MKASVTWASCVAAACHGQELHCSVGQTFRLTAHSTSPPKCGCSQVAVGSLVAGAPVIRLRQCKAVAGCRTEERGAGPVWGMCLLACPCVVHYCAVMSLRSPACGQHLWCYGITACCLLTTPPTQQRPGALLGQVVHNLAAHCDEAFGTGCVGSGLFVSSAFQTLTQTNRGSVAGILPLT